MVKLSAENGPSKSLIYLWELVIFHREPLLTSRASYVSGESMWISHISRKEHKGTSKISTSMDFPSYQNAINHLFSIDCWEKISAGNFPGWTAWEKDSGTSSSLSGSSGGPWRLRQSVVDPHGKSRNFITTLWYWLVVWTPLKNMKVNWDDYSQYMGK